MMTHIAEDLLYTQEVSNIASLFAVLAKYSGATWQKLFENVGQLMAHIKTYDQVAYETIIDGEVSKSSFKPPL